MKPDYSEAINAILAGSPIVVEAKKLGVNMNTLRRILIKHPDYEAAKADGRVRTVTPARLKYEATDSPAVAEVLAGSTVAAAAAKHGIPVTSLAKMVKIARPGISLQHRDKTPEELLALELKKATKAMEKVQAKMRLLPGGAAWTPPK